MFELVGDELDLISSTHLLNLIWWVKISALSYMWMLLHWNKRCPRLIGALQPARLTEWHLNFLPVFLWNSIAAPSQSESSPSPTQEQNQSHGNPDIICALCDGDANGIPVAAVEAGDDRRLLAQTPRNFLMYLKLSILINFDIFYCKIYDLEWQYFSVLLVFQLN